MNSIRPFPASILIFFKIPDKHLIRNDAKLSRKFSVFDAIHFSGVTDSQTADPARNVWDAPWTLTSSRKITVFKIKTAIFHFNLFGASLWAVNELLHFQKCHFCHKSLALKKHLKQFEEKTSGHFHVFFGNFHWYLI